ncbi:Z-ring formation inhibitor MciZ [Siminovitchia terrae]|nr:Z-ring formation inhibitor MciZ [Siminovitchia terrae]
MRVNISEDRIILTGKTWEIQGLLRKYAKQHKLVKDWIESCAMVE